MSPPRWVSLSSSMGVILVNDIDKNATHRGGQFARHDLTLTVRLVAAISPTWSHRLEVIPPSLDLLCRLLSTSSIPLLEG